MLVSKLPLTKRGYCHYEIWSKTHPSVQMTCRTRRSTLYPSIRKTWFWTQLVIPRDPTIHRIFYSRRPISALLSKRAPVDIQSILLPYSWHSVHQHQAPYSLPTHGDWALSHAEKPAFLRLPLAKSPPQPLLMQCVGSSKMTFLHA